MRVHGLDARQGETAFAFLVLRLQRPANRAELVELIRHVASVIPDAEAFISELPDEELDQPMRIVGMPWVPPEAGHAVEAQRRLIEAAGAKGVEEAWFFQTGTSLPSVDDEDDDDDDDDDEDEEADGVTGVEDPSDPPMRVASGTRPVHIVSSRAATTEDASGRAGTERPVPMPGDAWGASGWATGETGGADPESEDDEITRTQTIALEDPAGEGDDDDEDAADDADADAAAAAAGEGDADAQWSHGAPPMVSSVRFPVDGYPAIIEELDWEDFGIAFKLAGPALSGEGTVLLGLHALWLSPYGGRYRNADVTIDRAHHAAHLWVDRFAVPSSAEEQVHHLLWILSKLDEVIPVVHARFAGATMAQKYGGLMGDASAPFVLGGNPLLGVHATGGDAAVDRWIEGQSEWSNEEVAQMLRELAIELVTSSAADDDDATGDRSLPAASSDEDEDEDDDDEDDEDADEDEDAEDADDDEDDDEDRGRHVARYAGELLAARAVAGLLDARAADLLRPVLAVQDKYAHRRGAVVDLLGSLRDRASIAALTQVIDDNPIRNYLESIGREELLVKTATALGAIGDPAAIPALIKLVTAPGDHNDEARPAAADALATCLAATPEPRDVDDAVLAALLSPIEERNDGDENTRLHFAYGRLARVLSPARRDVARARLEASKSARDDRTPMLARHVALVLARGGELDPETAIALRPLVHLALRSLDYNHEHTLRNVRFGLRIAAELPALIAADDLVWLTRFSEPDVRAQAHALLDQLGTPLAPAPVFDRRTARSLADAELVRLIGEPHVVGRAALVAEAGRRSLASARGVILQAAHDVIGTARQGGANLLDPESRLLEAAVGALRTGPLDADVIALFDRMLRHSNYHVKWEVLQDPPLDERLLGGMFHVLAEKWGWQEKTAKQWLSKLQGSPAYEAERRRAGAPQILASDEEDDADDDGDDDVN